MQIHAKSVALQDDFVTSVVVQFNYKTLSQRTLRIVDQWGLTAHGDNEAAICSIAAAAGSRGAGDVTPAEVAFDIVVSCTEVDAALTSTARHASQTAMRSLVQLMAACHLRVEASRPVHLA